MTDKDDGTPGDDSAGGPTVHGIQGRLSQITEIK